MRRVWVPLVLWWSACSFDPSVPLNAVVQCSAESQACPVGYRCQVSVGRCLAVDSADREAPRIVETQLPDKPLREGETVRIAIVVSEPLGVTPMAALTQASRSTAMRLTQRSPVDFTLEHTVTAEDLEGPANVSVDLTDVVGNTALGVLVGALSIDKSPPQLISAGFVSPQPTGSEPLEVRSSTSVAVRLVMSEAVEATATLRGEGPCGAPIVFVLSANRGGLLDFNVAPPVGQAGCTYTLQLSNARDIAGNTVATLNTTLQLTVDDTPPVLSSVELVRPTDAGLVLANRFSRVPPFHDLGVRFVVGRDATLLTARLDDAEFVGCDARACTDDGGVRSCLCRRAVGTADSEGGHTVTVTAEDAAHNTRSVSATATYDFTGPQLQPGTEQLTLTPPTSCPRPTVLAGAPGAGVRVAVGFDEPATARLISAPQGLAFDGGSSLSTSATFITTLGPLPARQEVQQLTLSARDVVGNETLQPLSLSLLLDGVAPPAPLVSLPNTFTHVRVPWGDAAGGPRFALQVSADAGLQAGLLLRALDGAGANALEVGRGVATTGSWAMPLAAPDRRQIFVTAVDEACNQSAAVEVKDVEWVATLGNKRVGSGFENPHTYSTYADFSASEGLLGAGDAGAPDPTPTAVPGGSSVTAVGQVRWRPDGPGARRFSSVTYDTTRNRVVLFGGVSGLDHGDTWEWDGQSWTLRATTGPAPRREAGFAYDSSRKRAVLYGGSFLRLDTWEWDGWTWREVLAPGPGPRTGHAMAYDAARRRVVLFGGANNSSTWEFDGATWRLAATVGPSQRDGAGMAYDSTRRRVVLFGGQYTFNTQTVYSDLWEWDGVAWTQRPIGGGPSARFDHGLAYDEARSALIVHGGTGPGSLTLTDTWSLIDGGWAPLASTPPARTATATYDTQRQRVVSVTANQQPWEWNGLGWDAGVDPSCTSDCAMTADLQRGRLVLLDNNGGTWERGPHFWEPRVAPNALSRRGAALVFVADAGVLVWGGDTPSSLRRTDTSTWSGSGPWVERADAGPPPRYWHGMASDSARGRVVMYGGQGISTTDTWEWDGRSWASRASVGPAPRDRFAMAFDPRINRTVLFGGYGLTGGGATGVTGETFTWDGTSWTQGTGPEPTPRYGTAFAFDPVRQQLLLFGGSSVTTILGELWAWQQGVWTLIDANGPARLRPLFAWDPQSARLVLSEGTGTGNAALTDTWTYGLQPAHRPAQVACFSFAASGADGTETLLSVSTDWVVGANGAVNGAPTAGSTLWRREGPRFIELIQNSATTATPAAARWSTADAGTLAVLFEGAPRDLCIAATPRGSNLGATAAAVAVDYAEARVRYRRP